MTTPIIWIWGYEKWGNHVPLLKRVFSNHSQTTRGRGLLWVDVRRHRKVRAKGFTEGKVVENFAPDYVWIPEFGNEAVTGESSAMRLHDFSAGLKTMRATVARATTENKDIHLFCSCSHAYAYCHRHMVAYRLHEAEPSWTIQEWPGQDIANRATFDLRGCKVTASAAGLRVPIGAVVPGTSSPLVIPAMARVDFRVNGQEDFTYVGMVAPGADEKTAYLKDNDKRTVLLRHEILYAWKEGVSTILCRAHPETVFSYVRVPSLHALGPAPFVRTEKNGDCPTCRGDKTAIAGSVSYFADLEERLGLVDLLGDQDEADDAGDTAGDGDGDDG